MPNHYVDADVRCPFYRKTDHKSIHCEGTLGDRSSLINYFSYDADIKNWMKTYCCKNYTQCPLFVSISSKYQ